MSLESIGSPLAWDGNSNPASAWSRLALGVQADSTMAKSMRSFPVVFVVAMLVSMMVSAATPTMDCSCRNETLGLAVIGHEDVASIHEIPAGALQFRPRLQGVAGRIHWAANAHHAVMGFPSPTMLVPRYRQFLLPDDRQSWIDDPGVLTHASPRGPPAV
jgi:hypothetical protein